MKVSIFLEKLSQLEREDLLEINGLGPNLSENLLNFKNSSRFEKLVNQFQKLEARGKGLEVTLPEKKVDNPVLAGQKICITGSFEISREEIKEKLEALGAEVIGAVTKNTTLLLAGEKAGSKLQKAEKLGIKVLNDWREIIDS